MSNNPNSLLGYTVRDTITPLTGVVTAEIFYLYGCQQVQIVQNIMNADGKIPDPVWLDRTRVAICEDSVPVVYPDYSLASEYNKPTFTGFNGHPPARRGPQ